MKVPYSQCSGEGLSKGECFTANMPDRAYDLAQKKEGIHKKAAKAVAKAAKKEAKKASKKSKKEEDSQSESDSDSDDSDEASDSEDEE